MCILLYFVTLGIYHLYYFYVVHEELKQRTARGIGGVLALVLAFFVGIAMPFLTPQEVGDARKAAGLQPKVSALTGLWYFPGFLILIGPFIWFVKTNGALNDYWESQGVDREWTV